VFFPKSQIFTLTVTRKMGVGVGGGRISGFSEICPAVITYACVRVCVCVCLCVCAYTHTFTYTYTYTQSCPVRPMCVCVCV